MAAVVMCDLTRKETLEGAKAWKQSVDNTILLQNGQPVPCLLLANKVCWWQRIHYTRTPLGVEQGLERCGSGPAPCGGVGQGVGI